jgi:hypothetical protein
LAACRSPTDLQAPTPNRSSTGCWSISTGIRAVSKATPTHSRYTIFNLHAILANNLLADPTAAGTLRYIAVGIERSAFHPLEAPQLIEESFEQLLVIDGQLAMTADII